MKKKKLRLLCGNHCSKKECNRLSSECFRDICWCHVGWGFCLPKNRGGSGLGNLDSKRLVWQLDGYCISFRDYIFVTPSNSKHDSNQNLAALLHY